MPTNYICSALAGIVVTLVGIWFTHVKNAVSRDDMEKAIAASEAKFLTALQPLAEMQKLLSELTTKIAVLTDRSNRDEDERA